MSLLFKTSLEGHQIRCNSNSLKSQMKEVQGSLDNKETANLWQWMSKGMWTTQHICSFESWVGVLLYPCKSWSSILMTARRVTMTDSSRRTFLSLESQTQFSWSLRLLCTSLTVRLEKKWHPLLLLCNSKSNMLHVKTFYSLISRDFLVLLGSQDKICWISLAFVEKGVLLISHSFNSIHGNTMRLQCLPWTLKEMHPSVKLFRKTVWCTMRCVSRGSPFFAASNWLASNDRASLIPKIERVKERSKKSEVRLECSTWFQGWMHLSFTKSWSQAFLETDANIYSLFMQYQLRL